MTENTTPVEGTETDPTPVEGTPTTDTTPEAPEGSRAGRDAARYRTALREVEAERDALVAQLDAVRREVVENMAAKVVAQPSAVWAAGVNLADLLADDGRVDADKAHAAITSAADALGLAGPPLGNRRHVPPGRPAPDDVPNRLVDAFRPPSKRHHDSSYSW
ncbi:MAG: hypothetical protein FWF90_05090 [Promicromonosporaceae bacterium]|nr:hypothetical protein [Promicromonosporaceae bacterium]